MRSESSVPVRESTGRRRGAIGVIALLVVATLAMTLIVREREHRAARRDGTAEVTSAIDRLGSGLQGTSTMLASAAVLIDDSGAIDEARLETFANLLLASGPVFAVAYEPLITDAERDAFEQRAGHPIRDRAADGTFMVAPRRPTYHPVAIVKSRAGDVQDVVGFDAGADPDRGPTIRAASAGRNAVLTGVLPLATSGRPGFLIVQPLTRPNGGTAGVLAVGYDAEQIGAAIETALPAGVTFRIIDDGKELYRSTDDPDLGFSHDVALGGRTWRFEYDADVDPSRTVSTAILGGGTSLALLFALAAVLSFRNERRLLLLRLQTALERDLAAGLANAAGRDEVAATAARSIPMVAGAQGVSLGLIENGAVVLRHSASVPGRVAARWSALTLRDETPLTDAARTGRPVVFRDVPSLVRRYPNVELDPALRARAIACVPLLVGDAPIGALAFSFEHEQAFDDGQVRWLTQIGSMVAGALERARLYDDQIQTVLTLQTELLPSDLPEPEGYALSAIYRPGESAQVGGDWYDAFVLPDGRLGMAIGDVAGRGVRAAASMGKLRHIIRACAGAYGDPAVVLTHANRLVCQGGREVFATVMYATIDPVGRCVIASAGHLPPVVMAGSVASLVEVRPGPPLGVSMQGAYTDALVQMKDGDAIVLYTDGLIERRGVSLDDSLVTLAAVAGEMPGDADAAALVRAIGDNDLDDVAVLLVRLGGRREEASPDAPPQRVGHRGTGYR